jgi:GST-like protein
MIELYTWTTPNGRKVSIMLEECALPYRAHKINIGTNAEQFTPEYLKINPNGKIPSIVDPDGPDGRPIAMMESGAILIYLAEKTGKFLPAKFRYQVLQWLMFQMGGVGPMFGQAHHFMRAKKDEVPYGSERYGNEAKRLYGVMDRHLAGQAYFATEYSIADMAIYPWVARHEWHRVELGGFPHVRRWYDQVGARPAVQRGMAVPQVS